MGENYGLMFIKQHLGSVSWAGLGQFQISSPTELSLHLPEQEPGLIVFAGEAVCSRMGERWLVDQHHFPTLYFT